MKTFIRIAVSIVAISILHVTSGCRTFTSPARSHDLQSGIEWMDYDATRRGALILPTGADVRVLSEPAPDVAMATVADFTGKVSYQGASGEAAAKVTETIAELGKRTQTVMVLREALFRLNELQTYQKDLQPSDIKELYSKVLDTALEIAKADSDNAAAAKAENINQLLQNVDEADRNSILQRFNLK